MRRAVSVGVMTLLCACVPQGNGGGEGPTSEDAGLERDQGSGGSGPSDSGASTARDTGSPPERDAGGPPAEEDMGSQDEPDVAPWMGDDVCDRPDVTVCDDFESGSLDTYREINFGPSAVALDEGRAHSGSRSVRVDSTNFTQMLAVAVPAKRFFGRVYLLSDTPMNPGHNTYVNAGEGDGDPNHGEWVRIGEHREQLELNRKSDDKELLSSGDYNSLDGATQFAADTWYCLEFLFDGDAGEARVWVDEEPVELLHATDWYANYETFKFGYEKYHGPDKTLWYDDLALGTERIGCL